MSIEERLINDYKEAMKARDSLRSSVLNFLRAEMINAAIAKKKDKLDDNEAVVILRKQIKSRQESIEQFTKGARMDLADKEKKELEILKVYLPAELSPEEVKKIIEEAVVSLSACGMKDMGRVMKEVGARISGQADAKLVSDLVRERLSKVAG
jgi:uncharacterized protein